MLGSALARSDVMPRNIPTEAIEHEEMPQVRPEGVAGFQLWVNLPAKQKMVAPRYQNIHANEIVAVQHDGGATVRVIAGTVDGVVGPISGIAAEPMYLDVSIAPHVRAFRDSIADRK